MTKENEIKVTSIFPEYQDKMSNQSQLFSAINYIGLHTHLIDTGKAVCAFLYESEMKFLKQYLEISYSDLSLTEKKKHFEKIKDDVNNYYVERNDHPLVTDNKFLNLHYFPDVIPYNLEYIWNE